MENLKTLLTKLVSWSKQRPVWAKILLTLATTALFALMLFSCGTPKTVATVHNVNPNSQVTVTLSVSNSNDTEVVTNPTFSASKP